MSLETSINNLYEAPEKLSEGNNKDLVFEAIQLLDSGELRVCEKTDEQWTVNDWAKKAVLLYFRAMDMKVIEAGDLKFFDKIPLVKSICIGPEGSFQPKKV